MNAVVKNVNYKKAVATIIVFFFQTVVLKSLQISLRTNISKNFNSTFRSSYKYSVYF